MDVKSRTSAFTLLCCDSVSHIEISFFLTAMHAYNTKRNATDTRPPVVFLLLLELG